MIHFVLDRTRILIKFDSTSMVGHYEYTHTVQTVPVQFNYSYGVGHLYKFTSNTSFDITICTSTNLIIQYECYISLTKEVGLRSSCIYKVKPIKMCVTPVLFLDIQTIRVFVYTFIHNKNFYINQEKLLDQNITEKTIKYYGVNKVF